MNLYAYDSITFNLPSTHRFPLHKYQLLRQAVLAQPWSAGHSLRLPPPADKAVLLLAHQPAYVERVINGRLSAAEIRRIGLPWSPELVRRSCYSVGATIAASQDALASGLGITLGGGTHHACYAEGQGFCVFNDVVIAARLMQQAQNAGQILVIDADVHQGNGTAQLSNGDATIFSFSIHGQKNFPFRKIPGDIDIGLPDGAGDDDYLREFENGLRAAFTRCRPQLIYYLAGADVHQDDKLGRLQLTMAGIAARDQLVFALARAAGVPLVLTMAGGYGRHIHTTVRIHTETIRRALESRTVSTLAGQ